MIDLAALLSRMHAVSHPRGMTLLLDGSAATALGLPAKLPKVIDKHPTIDGARSVGWKVSSLSPWMTFTRNGDVVHVGMLPWLNARNFAFYANGDVPVMVDRLYRYHRLMGVPYFGQTAGLPAMSLLRDQHNGRKPMWTPRNWDEIAPANAATEVAPDWCSNDEHGMPYEHQYDARRQFLSSAGSIPLALGELYHRDDIEATRAPIPGYYLVTTPAWALNHALPHPIGNAPEGGAHRWVTAPTLALMYELADNLQILDYPQVHEAWIAENTYGKTGMPPTHSGRPLHRWATVIGKAIDQAEASGDAHMVTACKATYTHGIGMLARPRSRVYRPDWAHAIIALARANQFRKIIGTWYAEKRIPVRVEHDQVWYASTSRDPELNWPISFPKAPASGGYTAKATRTLEQA